MNNNQLGYAKAALAAIHKRANASDDGSLRAADYESLLDLFTLISLILMFVSLLYVGKAEGIGQQSAYVTSIIAKHASGPTKALPLDVTLMALYQENNNNMFAIETGFSGTTQRKSVNRNNISSILDSFLPVIKKAGKIELVIEDVKTDEYAVVAISTENWLNKNGLTNYMRIYH